MAPESARERERERMVVSPERAAPPKPSVKKMSHFQRLHIS